MGFVLFRVEAEQFGVTPVPSGLVIGLGPGTGNISGNY
jgi:hypothetical protein